MTLEERAARIAKLVVQANAIPYAVCATQHQQDKVLADATRTVLRELNELVDSIWSPADALHH